MFHSSGIGRIPSNVAIFFKKYRMKFANPRLLVSAVFLSAFSVVSAADSLGDKLLATAKTLFAPVLPVSEKEINTAEAVLGRALFWDTRISLDGKTACASCHAAEDWSADKRKLSINAKGQPTTMHSQAMFMAQDQTVLCWYGDRRDGAHQAQGSISGSMGFENAQAVVPALKAAGYEAAFAAAFPTPPAGQADAVTPENYARALQIYQRTLRTPAPFDQFLNGNAQALNTEQLSGLDKFVSYGCVGCHSGPLLGGNSLQKFGVVKDYWLATGSTKVDAGRFNITKKEEDKYVYRVPMLRNIAKTAPYFHDGSVDKLEDAVRVMAEVQLGRQAPDADVADIVAFLTSLTGDVPKHYAPPVNAPSVIAPPVKAVNSATSAGTAGAVAFTK
jgi:cytochrome c peroxidase